MTRSVFRCTSLLLAALAFAACGDDETAPEEGHTPVDAALFVDGVDVGDVLVLPPGEPVRVEVRFLNDEGEVITGIEDEHFAGLTFTPATLATVADVADHHFQKDVTGQAAGTGSVRVGYGHDEAADELDFGPFDVTVLATATAR
jgi:hypothetical protein